jgi:hypothetical protein
MHAVSTISSACSCSQQEDEGTRRGVREHLDAEALASLPKKAREAAIR